MAPKGKARNKKRKVKRQEEVELWDLTRQLPRSHNHRCSWYRSKACRNPAIAVWQSNRITSIREWYTCEDCQLKDFDGWPEGVIPWNSDETSDDCSSTEPTGIHARDEEYVIPEKESSKRARRSIASAKAKSSKKAAGKKPKPSEFKIRRKKFTGIKGSKKTETSANNAVGNQTKRFPPILPLQRSRIQRSTPMSSNAASGSNVSAPSFSTPPPENRHVARVVTPPSPLMEKDDSIGTDKSYGERTLATIRFYKEDKKWTDNELCFATPRRQSAMPSTEPHVYHLSRGGTLKIYPNLVSSVETHRIKEELMHSGMFRQYKVQSQKEPRLHFLLHEDATDEDFDTSPQPGYSYAHVKLKARPLGKLPELHNVSQRLASVSGVDKWTIGVNPVLYRGCRDKMGFHADDDQGEEVVLCLVVSSPQEEARRVIIAPTERKTHPEVGDEIVELMLQPGDAYEMDGEMQQYYVHSVPRETERIREDNSFSSRIVVVFRTGKETYYVNDTGIACCDLSPEPPRLQVFGNHIPGLVEGHVYPRLDLHDLCAHRMPQRGISGKICSGADAIIVSGLREDRLGTDQFLRFMYAAESAKGGKAVVTSFQKQLPIRVFRSSNYISPYRAQRRRGQKAYASVYRYDGLYEVVSCQEPTTPKGPFQFYLQRIDAGSNESDPMTNRIRNEDFANTCCRLGTLMNKRERELFEYNRTMAAAKLSSSSSSRTITEPVFPKRQRLDEEIDAGGWTVLPKLDLPVFQLARQMRTVPRLARQEGPPYL